MRYTIEVHLKRGVTWIFSDMPAPVELTDKDMLLEDADGKYCISRDCIEMVSCKEWVPPKPKQVEAPGPKSWWQRM